MAHWESVADAWIAWARKPGHDAFWAYQSQLSALIGRGGGAAIDIGCGEGRLSALLGDLGWHVTATDAVAAMVAAAQQKGSADAYKVAPATRLPFASKAFDLALLHNVLTEIDAPGKALAEARRLLRDDGRLLVSIRHPFSERMEPLGATAQAAPGIAQDYFEPTVLAREEEQDGLTLRFRRHARPLTFYTESLHRAGFAITRLIEPRPAPQSRWAGRETWSRVPLLVWIEAQPLR